MDELNGNVTVEDGIVSVKSGSYVYYPIYLQQPIQDGQCFRVNIIDVAEKQFRIGVGFSDLKPTNWTSSLENNVCIHAEGYLFSDGAREKLDF